MSRTTRAKNSGFETQLAVAGVPLTGGEGGRGRIGDRTYLGPFTAYRPPTFRLEMACPSWLRTWPARTET